LKLILHSIAQARTGTGKTVGFLLPTIQNILTKNPELAQRQRYTKARSSDIRAIIISPTRELAMQIATEAEKLCRNTDLVVQLAVGGTGKRLMLHQMQRQGCHLLVATPGRLNDLLTDQYSRVSAPQLTTLVLDEADRLLEGGFADDIQDIIDLLPNREEVDRQTLLFSATVPREVMQLVRRTLKPNFHFVQTVKQGELATHEKVPQKVVVCNGYENFMPALLELAKREIQKHERGEGPPFKAIVYFNSTANVVLGAEIFRNLQEENAKGLYGRHPLYPAEILEIHSQLTQEGRTRTTNKFRACQSGFLFSTDVSARGMDFPNVSHVIQIGFPGSRDQYIHRVGRTGRGDKEGIAYLLITGQEVKQARMKLRGLPLDADKTIEAGSLDMTSDAQLPASLAATLTQIGNATKMVGRGIKEKAYLGALGGLSDPPTGILMLNQWVRYGWGWEVPPPIGHTLARRLRIQNVPGVNIDSGRARSEPGNSTTGFDNGRSDAFGAGRGGFGGRSGGGRGGFGDRSGHRSGERGFGGDRRERSFGVDRGGSGGRGGGYGDRDGGRSSGFESDKGERRNNLY